MSSWSPTPQFAQRDRLQARPPSRSQRPKGDPPLGGTLPRIQRMRLRPLARLSHETLDVLLELLLTDAPHPPPTGLDGGKLARPHQRVDWGTLTLRYVATSSSVKNCGSTTARRGSSAGLPGCATSPFRPTARQGADAPRSLDLPSVAVDGAPPDHSGHRPGRHSPVGGEFLCSGRDAPSPTAFTISIQVVRTSHSFFISSAVHRNTSLGVVNSSSAISTSESYWSVERHV